MLAGSRRRLSDLHAYLLELAHEVFTLDLVEVVLHYERLDLGRLDRAALLSGVHEYADALATFKYFLQVILRQLTLDVLSFPLSPQRTIIRSGLSSRLASPLWAHLLQTDSDYSLFRGGRLGILRARGKLELDLSFGVQDEARAKMFAASASESRYYVICTSLCK